MAAIELTLNLKGFIAINNEDRPLNETLTTGLPKGRYCDIVNGHMNGKFCSGRVINLSAQGLARIIISHYQTVPIVAINLRSKI